MRDRILLWYRLDLRVTDHEPLDVAVNSGAEIFPFFCFDDRLFAQTSLGFSKTGKFRAKFLRESIADLRQNLRELGSDLLVRKGLTELVISELIAEFKITAIYFHTYPTSEEMAIETAVVRISQVPCRSWWGHTLQVIADLPMHLNEVPELFTKFRQITEANGLMVRDIVAAPSRMPAIAGIEVGEIPSLMDCGASEPIADDRAVMTFLGGEAAGLARIEKYFWKQDLLRSYKETRNGLIGADYSSKLSPWLAMGCLSPRYIYAEVRKYERDRIKNDSTYWLIFELLWRDFFALMAAKHGDRLFRQSGLRGVNLPWQSDKKRFELWCRGQTGVPFIDANMRELLATGFMSNRGRQNVASYLTKTWNIDWRWGAAWFESLLIDYDVASNWGNWNYLAGVGNDARSDRVFNPNKQARDYDPQGEYVKRWNGTL
jgi:deoxyribodipyrimidine photo-lyase